MLRESFKLFIQNGHETHSNKQTNIYFHEKKIMHSHTHSYVYRMGTALCGEDEEEEEEEDVTSLENAEKM